MSKLFYIVCTLENASEEINGIKFKTVKTEDAVVVISVDPQPADIAASFAGIPGYVLDEVDQEEAERKERQRREDEERALKAAETAAKAAAAAANKAAKAAKPAAEEPAKAADTQPETDTVADAVGADTMASAAGEDSLSGGKAEDAF